MILEIAAAACLTFPGPSTPGASRYAEELAKDAENEREYFLSSNVFGRDTAQALEKLDRIERDHSVPNWDGDGALPVARDAIGHARDFIKALPLDVPRPAEIDAEPDGHVCLEWYRSPYRLLSVSISPDGTLYYAALLSSRRRNGSEPYSGEASDDIVDIIRKVGPVGAHAS